MLMNQLYRPLLINMLEHNILGHHCSIKINRFWDNYYNMKDKLKFIAFPCDVKLIITAFAFACASLGSILLVEQIPMSPSLQNYL